MNRRGFFGGLAASIGAAALKVGIRIAYVRNSAQLRALLQSGQKVDKIVLKAGEVYRR